MSKRVESMQIGVDAVDAARHDGRLTVLHEVLEILKDVPELNIVNYNHDDVCELNDAATNAYLAVKAMVDTEVAWRLRKGS